jgi:acyl-homoserine-lactone acylase
MMNRNRAPLLRALPVLALLLAVPGCTTFRSPPPPAAVAVQLPLPIVADSSDPRVEVLWDSYGVPHIFADDASALLYAFGWAQMRSHGDLLLRLYGQARGRAAEYWGEAFVDSDVWIRTNGVPERAESWLAEQSPYLRALMHSFAAGINEYAAHHIEDIGEAWRVVLPVTAADILAHQQRVLNFTFMANPAMAAAVSRQWQSAPQQPAGTGSSGEPLSLTEWAEAAGHVAQPGSNAWAVAPARSTSGNALLLANPHLPWGDLYTFYEAQLVTPELNVYGATLVGFPLLNIAFNEHLGWTHTVNTMDGADIYELTVEGNSYRFDGIMHEFAVEQQVLRVRQPDGSLAERPLTIRRSLHGPVFAERPGRALALRVAGLETAHLAQQYLDMARSENRGQFEAVLSRLQLPFFTVMYADRHGEIMHVFNGTIPVRPHGDWLYWQGIVPGDTSATLWTRVHDFHYLPRIVNPPSGWLQNANDPPWTTTIPFAIDPLHFPPYMAPQRPMSFRAQRSARMLHELPRISFEQMLERKHSTRMQAADHLVHDVVAAARVIGDSTARQAADVLERWDRMANADSRGAVLFAAYFRAMQRQRWPAGSMFEVPWSPRAPLATPDGLANPTIAVQTLSEVATQVAATYGSLDVAWGDVHRLRMGDLDLPASGGPDDVGIFRVIDFQRVPGDNLRLTATSGDSYVAVIEFSRPVRARSLMSYGNASQPGSPHRSDQLELFARNQLRPVWLTREEINANLSRREAF